MKLAEVKDGFEYAALESPTSTSRYRPKTPRHVRVLGREKIEQKRYGAYSTRSTTQMKTVLKVEFVDEPTPGADRYDHVATAAQGSTRQIEARQLVGLWTEVLPHVLERHEAERVREEYKAGLNARLAAIFGDSERAPYVTVTTYDGKPSASVHLHDVELNLLLDLAEKGRA